MPQETAAEPPQATYDWNPGVGSSHVELFGFGQQAGSGAQPALHVSPAPCAPEVGSTLGTQCQDTHLGAACTGTSVPSGPFWHLLALITPRVHPPRLCPPSVKHEDPDHYLPAAWCPACPEPRSSCICHLRAGARPRGAFCCSEDTVPSPRLNKPDTRTPPSSTTSSCLGPGYSLSTAGLVAPHPAQDQMGRRRGEPRAEWLLTILSLLSLGCLSSKSPTPAWPPQLSSQHAAKPPRLPHAQSSLCRSLPHNSGKTPLRASQLVSAARGLPGPAEPAHPGPFVVSVQLLWVSVVCNPRYPDQGRSLKTLAS